MLGVDRRGDQVGDLRERPGGHVLGELVGQGAGRDPAQPPLEEAALPLRERGDALVQQPEEPGALGLGGAADLGVEGLHEGVAAGLGQGLAGDGLEGGVELDLVVGEVLPLGVRPPAAARLLQPLGVGGPVVAGVGALVVGVVADGPLPVRLEAGLSAPEVVAVGAGGGVDGGVVGVADGERVGELVVERDVAAVVVRHGGGGLGADPAVHPAAAPGFRPAVPGVVEGADVLEVLLLLRGGLAHREGQHGGAGRVGLLEHRAAGGQLDGVAVAEAAYAAQGAEVVVERTVLLHEDHHVLDRPQSAGPRVGGLRGDGGLERGRQERSGRSGAECAAAQREEPSP